MGAKARPPKNPRRPPKKGTAIPTSIVKAATKRKNMNKGIRPPYIKNGIRTPYVNRRKYHLINAVFP